MNETEVMAALESKDAVRRGHFRLSSGLHSDLYVQCALALAWPGIAERFGHDLAQRLASLEATTVIGPAMGGLIIAHEVARALGVRMVFAERVNAEMTLRRGFELARSERVLVIEDVVTTGRSPREVIALAHALGAEAVGVGSIVDRSEDPPFDIRFTSLIRVHAQRWEADACPLCASGEPIDTPGSRHLAPRT